MFCFKQNKTHNLKLEPYVMRKQLLEVRAPQNLPFQMRWNSKNVKIELKSMERQKHCRIYVLNSDLELNLAWNELLDDEIDQGDQLLEAATQDDFLLVTELLSSNPHLIWHRDSVEGNMVFHVVARDGHSSTFKRLMEFIHIRKYSTFNRRFPLLETNKMGNTPLHLALNNNHLDMASHLIKQMPPNYAFAKNKHRGIMPVNLAIRARCRDLVQVMLRRAPWSSLHHNKRHDLLNSSLVHDTIVAKDLELLQLVLENMPALIESKFEGRKPLQYAAYKGCVDEFCYILDKFPSYANKCYEDGSLPMLDAIVGDHPDIVKEIVARFPKALDRIYKVNPIFKVHCGCRPLSIASRLGCLDMVCFFLDNFPSYASKCDEDGSFPIHNAVAYGHLDIVKEFISRCPETMSHVNREGRSILHLVIEYARTEVFSYLKTIPDLKKMYHRRDAKGYTFVDLVYLAKTQMKKRKRQDEL